MIINIRAVAATSIVAIISSLIWEFLLKEKPGIGFVDSITIIIWLYTLLSSLPALDPAKIRTRRSAALAAAGPVLTGSGPLQYGLIIAGSLAVSNMILAAALGVAVASLIVNGRTNPVLDALPIVQRIYALSGPFVYGMIMPILCVVGFLGGQAIYAHARRRPILAAALASLFFIVFKIFDEGLALTIAKFDVKGLLGIAMSSFGLFTFPPVAFVFVGLGASSVFARRMDWEIFYRARNIAPALKSKALEAIQSILGQSSNAE